MDIRIAKLKKFGIFLVFAIAALIRIIVFLQTDNYGDAEALGRVQQTVMWMKEPSMLPSPTQQPLYFYLLRWSLKLYYNPLLVSRLLNLFLGIATVYIFFRLLRLLSSEGCAVFSTLLLALYPLHINLSVNSSSAIPFTFFVFLGLLLIFMGLRKENLSQVQKRISLSLGTFFLTAAYFTRFEGFLLIPLVLCFILFKKEKSSILTFVITFAISFFLFEKINYSSQFSNFSAILHQFFSLTRIHNVEGNDISLRVWGWIDIMNRNYLPIITFLGFAGLIRSLLIKQMQEFIVFFGMFFFFFFFLVLFAGPAELDMHKSLSFGLFFIPFVYQIVAFIPSRHGLRALVILSISLFVIFSTINRLKAEVPQKRISPSLKSALVWLKGNVSDSDFILFNYDGVTEQLCLLASIEFIAPRHFAAVSHRDNTLSWQIDSHRPRYFVASNYPQDYLAYFKERNLPLEEVFRNNQYVVFEVKWEHYSEKKD